MTNEIIPVEVKYSTSLEKWRGIRKFAELNGLDTSKIDAMIARIKEKGDASLRGPIIFEIRDYDGFFDSIFTSYEHPCPHCHKYACSECPLDDENPGCCKEWNGVKDQLWEMTI